LNKEVAYMSNKIQRIFGLVPKGREIIDLLVDTEGEISVSVVWSDGPDSLAVILNGPGQINYYARQDGRSPITLTYAISSQDMSRGQKWQVSVVNFSIRSASQVTAIIEFPGGMLPQPISLIPGLVLGLRHNLNQERESANKYIVFFSASANAPVKRMDGGDLGAPLHRGYEWWMVQDDSHSDSWKLPQGVVLGLKHSQNQKNAGITVFGHDPHSGPNFFSGFKKQNGGDLGAPSGVGYYWYESTGEGFNDWTIVDKLPNWTVIGLKHSINQRDKKISWQGKIYDPANPKIAPPSGFMRIAGGDLGAPRGEGYCWYEKVTGPELIVKPLLQVKLKQSLIVQQPADTSIDRDHDGLVDTLEGELANAFRPYIIFDSAESARQEFEPVTLFQVRPVNLLDKSKLRIGIMWVFLFRNDGGYGPDSFCRDAHEGDNDSAYYELESNDEGVTWTLCRACLSSKGIEWPLNSRLEVYDLTHPIIYMSAGKHHEYFTRDNDHCDSRYSDWYCNDDVNGLGHRVLVDLHSIGKVQPKFKGLYNNVGEPGFHGFPFVNDLSPYYPEQSAWGTHNFYDVGPNYTNWMPKIQVGGGGSATSTTQPPKKMK
jgi:hypothetical protein